MLSCLLGAEDLSSWRTDVSGAVNDYLDTRPQGTCVGVQYTQLGGLQSFGSQSILHARTWQSLILHLPNVHDAL
jgi:hypothetical protein